MQVAKKEADSNGSKRRQKFSEIISKFLDAQNDLFTESIEKGMPATEILRKICLVQMFMYGKEASNQKQEIERQRHTIPNKRTKD